MNKIFLSFLLFSLISCSSNDEEQDFSNKASIVGKWYVEKAEIYRSLNQQTQTSFSTDCQKMSTHEFTATHLISISYAQINNTCEKTDAVTKKYIFDKGNGKFWFENEENYPYFVTQLNQTDMVMEDRTQDFDGDGTKDVLRRFYKRIN
ncbi:Lipocalin-like domain-containing protein [Chryseobacterium taichungense]|uniref:Lipocalin-like domain-containing protein n=1 Tax=Chryseobacterium taichungense TaxID=295069 RepID=A0A1H8AGJ7_9FLAO|nr:lipocalin family protein [Chryseobacterium taichungense]SEM69932.1 Lipocalin-like domain-containing protein [Chryseobacterium taichungense]